MRVVLAALGVVLDAGSFLDGFLPAEPEESVGHVGLGSAVSVACQSLAAETVADAVFGDDVKRTLQVELRVRRS
jgi:hypothetical protein